MKLDLRRAMTYAAKVIRSRILLQIPKGDLKRSLEVTTNRKGEIIISYNDYGTYTNLGTGKYKIDEATDFKGYKKGVDGLQAQEWSAIPESDMVDITDNFTKEINKALNKIKDPYDLVDLEFKID